MDDWDLHAVVRGCAAANTPTTTSTSSSNTCTASPTQAFGTFQQDYNFSWGVFQDLFERSRIDGLYDIYQPFIPKSSQRGPISPLSVLGGLQDLSSEPEHQQKVMDSQLYQTELIRPRQQLFPVASGSKTNISHNNISRSKRRRNILKKVCHVAAENLSCDVWSWRKYGQKPIKGSPYPRGYYKCSTSKGCMARKQVERNRSDPGMFIVTYTAEHNHPLPTHRNSLIGKKPNETPNSNEPSCSPALEKLESSQEEDHLAEVEDDDFSVSKMGMDDDFFAGLEDFVGPDAVHLPGSLPFPWPATTAAAAGGG